MGEVQEIHSDAMATALYGAVRSAGEFVLASPDRKHALAEAIRSLDLILEGLQSRS